MSEEPESDEQEDDSAPEVAGKDVDVPHYLFLTDEKLRAEARRAYALNCITSNDGLLSLKWKEEWPDIIHMLEHGSYVQSKKPRVVSE